MPDPDPRHAAPADPVPETRSGPPRWMLLTGCGCLVPGFLLVSAGAFFLQQMGGLMNQQRAWDDLSALIDYDPALRGTLLISAWVVSAPSASAVAWVAPQVPAPCRLSISQLTALSAAGRCLTDYIRASAASAVLSTSRLAS